MKTDIFLILNASGSGKLIQGSIRFDALRRGGSEFYADEPSLRTATSFVDVKKHLKYKSAQPHGNQKKL
jgi:hypothetical protein